MTVIAQITYMDKLIRDAIRNDGWEFWCIWGVKGFGKTSLALGLSYRFYHSWQKVFKHLVFTDTQLRDLLLKQEDDPNYRVPLVVWDDPAVHMSKYKFRDMLSVEFMEFFAGIRPRLAILIVTAPLPTSLLKGLREDYTATIFLPKRGYYIFQRHVWQEDYRSIRPRFRKLKEQEGFFSAIPPDVYEQYKILRHKFLVEKKYKRLMVLEAEDIINKLTPLDFKVLWRIFKNRGMNAREFRRGKRYYEEKSIVNKLEAFGCLVTYEDHIYVTDLGKKVALEYVANGRPKNPAHVY
ncbi:hypothetical protein DRO69_02025 [Candidatus Bathyarchaeota archaeon]|nr:MAG: hypothetical protein DRO69_02025 [Candidatus Bathyarchaeota archaeon]